MRRDGSQRGVALLTAIILVALTTMIAAAIAFGTAMSAHRSSSVIDFDAALQFAGGAEAFAAWGLSEDSKSAAKEDTAEEPWAQPFGPIEVAPGIQFQAQLTDLQGRFNLNSLVDDKGKKSPKAYEVFQRLLRNLDLEPKWADMAVDWIDADDLPEPNGAEDNVYSSESPPYRPPNSAMVSVSELLALKDFGPERYEKLKDYVSALPRSPTMNSTPINLCTASGALIDALFNSQQFTKNPQGLAILRKGKCFPQESDLNLQNPTEAKEIKDQLGIGTTSQYFRLTSLISIGTSQFALYSFLQRTNTAPGASQTLVISRRFTE